MVALILSSQLPVTLAMTQTSDLYSAEPLHGLKAPSCLAEDDHVVDQACVGLKFKLCD
jgi:hypothetical protein